MRNRYAHRLHRVTHLVADVDAIGQLAAEHAEMLIRQVDVQRMLARQFQEVAAALATRLSSDHQGPHAAARGDDVFTRQRTFQRKARVDVVQYEVNVRVSDAGVCIVNRGIGRAYAGAHAHRNGEEQAPVVGKEGQHAFHRRQSRHDQMHALGQHMAMLRALAGQLVVCIDKRPGRVDQRPGADRDRLPAAVTGLRHPVAVCARGTQRLHIVGRNAATVERRADEIEHEARIVVVQKGIRIFHAAGAVRRLDDGFLALNVRP